MAPPGGAPVTGDDVGITQRELLMEMREDIKGLKITVDTIAADQAMGVERRRNMQGKADEIHARLLAHDRELDDLRRWRDRADGGMMLARWALGASLVSLAAVIVQAIGTFAPEVHIP